MTFCFIWFNDSRLFIHYTYTQNSLHFNSRFFTSCTSTPLYIYTLIALTLLFHIIQIRMSWLQPRRGGLHFILSDIGNYDFDVKVGHCRFVSFVNDVVDCVCLGCVFYFRIKEKEKYTFYINFYSIIFL